jgi:hypothetical protein
MPWTGMPPAANQTHRKERTVLPQQSTAPPFDGHPEIIRDTAFFQAVSLMKGCND